MSLLVLLKAVLILGILFGIIYAIVRSVPIPEPWRTIALLIVALIAVVIVFDWLGASGLLNSLHVEQQWQLAQMECPAQWPPRPDIGSRFPCRL